MRLFPSNRNRHPHNHHTTTSSRSIRSDTNHSTSTSLSNRTSSHSIEMLLVQQQQQQKQQEEHDNIINTTAHPITSCVLEVPEEEEESSGYLNAAPQQQQEDDDGDGKNDKIEKEDSNNDNDEVVVVVVEEEKEETNYVDPAPISIDEEDHQLVNSRYSSKKKDKKNKSRRNDKNRNITTKSPSIMRRTWHGMMIAGGGGGGGGSSSPRRFNHSLPFHQHHHDHSHSSNSRSTYNDASSAAAGGGHYSNTSNSVEQLHHDDHNHCNNSHSHNKKSGHQAPPPPLSPTTTRQKNKRLFRRTWHGSHNHNQRKSKHGLAFRRDFHHRHRSDAAAAAGAGAASVGSGSESETPSSPTGSVGRKMRMRRSRHHHHHDHSSGGDHHHHNVLRSAREGSVKVVQKTGHAFHNLFHAIEEFFFPKSPFHEELSRRQHPHSDTGGAVGAGAIPKVRGGVWLRGCYSDEDHRAKVRELMSRLKNSHGIDGLREVMGLEYRLLPCEAHTKVTDPVAPARLSIPEECEAEVEVDATETASNENDAGNTATAAAAEADAAANTASWTGLGLTIPGLEPNKPPELVSTASTSVRSVCSEDIAAPGGGCGSSTAADVEEGAGEASECGCDNKNGKDLSLEFAAVAAAVEEEKSRCNFCEQRLYHIATNTLLTVDNRKLYIADGDHYDMVARLCQEYAHECMIREANLKWIPIKQPLINRSNSINEVEMDIMKTCPPQKPIRILVNADHPILAGNDEAEGWDNSSSSSKKDRPTVVIATGRGKVSAGIFSRNNLMCNGLETSSAVPVLRECLERNLNVVIVDPNINGERLGYVTFEKTMDFIVRKATTTNDDEKQQQHPADDLPPSSALDLLVLSHSASGGHFARYLLEKSDDYLDRIRAIAFTDSTHNIQWAKTKDKPALYDFLESDKCVYFRSSQVRNQGHENSKWYLHRAGEPIKTDTFWQRRFGKIRTFWAGTNEHSMTNWYAHTKIWEHFDSFLDEDIPGNKDGLHNNKDSEGLMVEPDAGSSAVVKSEEERAVAPAAGAKEEKKDALDPYHKSHFNSRSNVGRIIQL